MAQQDKWGSKIGLILAMAGSAVGLGNFLRFPVQAVNNGGGAFMIPYFCAFLFLGIPMMWAEWSMGRFGGKYGHSTCPGIFNKMSKNPIAKYFGILGIILPFCIAVYYLFIESWTMAFTYFSATGQYSGLNSLETMSQFLKGYQGVESNQYFSGFGLAVFFFITCFLTNFYVLHKGVSKGIEVLAKYGMPLLIVFGAVLMVRILTLGAPVAGQPTWNAAAGMAFMWNPDFSQLSKASIWLAAAGQIFFTLSLASGLIQAYSSYLKEKDDVVATGLATCSTNEFCEVIFGGTIAIPAAVAFFGIAGAQAIAAGGSFNLGFVAMPLVFNQMPFGQFFGALWFFLLFIAGITSSVALMTPAINFLTDELGWTRKKAVNVSGAITLLAGALVVAYMKYGFLDEMDYWAGTFGLVLFAVIEVIMFAWIFGMDRAWAEIHKGANFQVPKIFYYVLKYITPTYLIFVMVMWFKQDAINVLFMKGVPEANKPYIWAARLLMLALATAVGLAIRKAFQPKAALETEALTEEVNAQTAE